MQLEHIGGILFVASAVVFVAAMFIPSAANYKKYGEYGAIIGAGLWVAGKVM